MLESQTLICILLAMVFGNAGCANILAIFPAPAKSHYVMYKRILDELAMKGHQIDLYSKFPESSRVDNIEHYVISGRTHYDVSPVTDTRSQSAADMVKIIFEEKSGGIDLCEKDLQSEALKNLKARKKRYDVLLVEMFLQDCMYGFAHLFNTPVVSLTTSVDLPWGANKIGNINNPAYIPHYFSGFGEEMNLFQRFWNTFTLVQVNLLHRYYQSYQEDVAREFFGNNLPPLNDLIANSSLFLVNSHFSLNQARPKLPNFIEIAGLHVGKPKPLTKEFSDIVRESKFIYFSFGSIAKSEYLPTEMLKDIFKVLSKLKYKVLWKAERADFPREVIIPDNVHIIPWMPQLDLLCHPNISLFITHSGLMGTQEAIYCGVPMLNVPIFCDQFSNAKTIETKGVGLTLNLEAASKEDIHEIILELVENPKYKKNVEDMSEQFKDRPIHPLDEAVYWIEYVIRYKGARQLRSAITKLTWYQYHLIDILVLSCVLISAAILFIYLALRALLYILYRDQNCIKEKVA